MEDNDGLKQRVEGTAIAELFREFKKEVNCVVLNACNSAKTAEQISKHIEYVICMRTKIRDDAGIKFSEGILFSIFCR